MIPIKNPEAIRRMREACAIAATILARLKAQVRPGITTYDLDQIGRDLISSFGARSAPYGYKHGSGRPYPAYTCLSVNEEVVHGIGSLKRILRDGDIISVDVTVEYNGYIGDNAVTVPVGAIAPRTAELLKVTWALSLRFAVVIPLAVARPPNASRSTCCTPYAPQAHSRSRTRGPPISAP